MIPLRSRSHRTLPVLGLALALAATLPSCSRGADTPPASNQAAAEIAPPAPALPPPRPQPDDGSVAAVAAVATMTSARPGAARVRFERDR